METIKNYSKVKTLTKALLIVIGGGMLLTTAIMAPNAIQILRPFLGNGKRSNYERERIRQALRLLEKGKKVEYVEKNGTEYVRVTKYGNVYQKEYELDSIMLWKGKWDSHWRLVFFDIPEKYAKGRRALQKRLKLLGCFPLQRSVFVYPHDCEDEIDFVASFFNVQRFVYYAKANNLGRGEGRARRFYGLL